ncbi:MAG: zinc ABC transporter substrate-binding protein [Candidatus Electrothrix sp. GW3-4]|uniref:metal ABC transporter solute-binding protein, Zn/Mn family n=1 Tax=Candidatus Electrothrix sp. GW3-4 TaxID=3126740 RepID=UPI0030D1A141
MEKILRPQFVLVLCLVLSSMQAYAQEGKCRLNIGASLHPYYSWTKNIVGDEANVTSIIPPGSDPHAYQPLPSDMKKLENLDVVIVNGVGHDEFIKPMLKAIENDKLVVIDTSKGLPLIPVFGKHYDFEGNDGKVSYNSHTYIAITGAIQQMQMIARKLGRLCPDQAGEFVRNVRAYSMKLRNLLQSALMRIDMLDLNKLRIATVHDGYSYLFQELGIEVSAVVQPRHGVKPSARQLQDTIKRIKRAKVNVLFGELDYEKKYIDIIYKETGCRLYALSHISNGEYTKEFFEQAMRRNIDAIVAALTEVSGGSNPGDMSGQMQDNMSRQMQNASQQMQNSVQENLKDTVPTMQQKQMSERMNQQVQDTTKQMQKTVQEKLKDSIPTMQQKQMNKRMNQQLRDTKAQMQGAMQEGLQETLPAMQQQQVKERMDQQMQDMQKGMLENLAPEAPQQQDKDQ